MSKVETGFNYSVYIGVYILFTQYTWGYMEWCKMFLLWIIILSNLKNTALAYLKNLFIYWIVKDFLSLTTSNVSENEGKNGLKIS